MRSSSRSQRLAIAAMVTVLALLSGSSSLLTTSAQSGAAPDQPSGLSTEAGDTQVRLSWEDPTDSTIDKYQLWQIAESATLTGGTNDEFGNAAAVDSNTAVIGAPADDGSGSVLVFARDLDSGVWSQAAKLKASDAGVGDNFGTSVALDGNTVVVGASLDTHGLLGRAGSVYVFTKPASGWADWDPTQDTETAKIVPAGFAAGDEFGHSVAVDDSTGTIVAGARQDDSNEGSAYVFTEPTGGWSGWDTLTDPAKANLTATLIASNAAVNDYFGHSVAVDGDTVLIGASGRDSGKGAVYVFTKPETDGGWTGNLDIDTGDATKLTASDGANDDFLGASVAIDDGTAVIGAIGDDANEDDGDDTNNLTNAGSAYVFIEGPSAWSQAAKLTASDREVDERDDSQFGISVAVSGDIVVIGADGVDQSATETNFGAAYVFTKPTTGWADNTETAKLTASDGNTNHDFGSSVAIDGDTVVVGAENNDTAYVFDIDDWADIAGSNAATTSHIVTGLTNDIDHIFRVRALDSAEASDPSDSVAGTPKAASYAPVKLLNFSAAQTGDGQVEMTWDAHRYPLTVSGYEYNQDGGDWDAITGSDSSTHSHTVTGLTKGTTYTFAVRAVNGAGSTESDSRSVTIIGQSAVPDSFTAVAGDEQVWLGWRSPPDFTISGYEYRQKEGTGAFGVWQIIPGSRSGTTFHIVTGLSNDTSYTFQVRAANAAGESDASREQPATPDQASSAPVKPEGFAARQTGDGQVELTWEASSNPLNVTSYQLRQNNGSWTTISESDSRTVSHSVTNLGTGKYGFRVRAVNNSGNGASSGAESVIVVAEPAAPTDLAAQAGDTQVGLTWKDPGDASIAKYQIFQFPESVIKLISSDRDDEDELGWSVAVDDDTLVIGALGDDDTIKLSGSAYVFTRVVGGWTQAGKLTASDPKEDAGFGHAVAVHGDTIVVGAYEEDHTDNNNPIDDVGAAYVFTRPATGWADMTQMARLTASDAVANDEFGTSVAVHEDTIVVGAPEKDTNPDPNVDNARGSAYIFTKPANGWAGMTETATLRGQSDGDRFGRSVAVHGDTVVVGAFEVNGARGAAYVFTKRAATGVWDDWDDTSVSNATPKLTASDRASNDRFGRAVAMDGDTIVIGAPYHDYDDPDNNTNDVSNSGAAYVFIKPATGGWATDTETAKLTASERVENDQFGYSVAVDGNTVVVGADQDDSNRGSAYVFTEPQGGWTDTEGTDPLTAYDRSGNDRFGNFVAVDGDTVLVGAVGDDSDKGSAYVFGTGEWADIPGSGAGTISHIARGLRNNVKHTFRVRAVNAAGESDASEVATSPPPATFGPSQPADLTATQTGVGQVLLAWTASTEPLTVRRYQYKQNDGSGFGNWINIEGSDSSTASHTITSLVGPPPDVYTFTVGAVNGGGQNASNPESVTLEAQAAAPSEFTAGVGDEQVKLSWDDPDDSTIAKYQLSQIDTSKLTVADGLRGDEFGYSVAVDGNTAVIGAYQDDHTDDGGNTIGNAGSAYVFTKVSGVWRQLAKITATDGDTSDEFGYSVAVDGDTIVVGAHLDDHTDGDGDTDDDEGAAYVFTKPANGWADMTQTAKLTAFGAAANDEFGISVAVDGNTVLVGAHQYDSGKGAAYVFTKPYTGWADSNETAKFIASDAAANDEFGISVALDGDTAVIGAYHDDHTDDGNTIGNAGSAYVFTKVSGVWSQKAKLIAVDGAANDEFGISVAVNGDTVVFGARQDDTSNGAAYVFTEVSGVWKHVAKLTADDGAANDEFGISVAVDGDTIVVGAHQDDDKGDLSGSAYVFTRDSAGGWRQREKLTASDGEAGDRYGYSVGVSGDTVVVGAYSDDRNEANTGAAYFLRIPGWTDILDSAATTISHIVTGLTNNVEHTFQVRGVNAAGGGSASARVRGTPTFAIPNRPTGFAADAGDAVVDLSWVGPEDSTIDKYQLLQIIQGGKLTTASTDDPVVWGDGFGISVAVDGNTAVVGAYKDDDDGANSGSAHVYTRSSSTAPWNWAAKLTAFGAAANDEFGISVAVHGDTIVVGAHQNDADQNDNDEGAAYVFTKVSGVWGQKAKLAASDATADDAFGISVAVHDETVVVGAHLENANDDDVDTTDDVTDSGAAYVFTKPESGGWADATETAKLTASDGAASDAFGISVAVHDETVVVGAHLENANDDDQVITDDVKDSGAAYVFTKPGSGGWADATETAKLTAFDAAENDAFGISVAVHDETVVVGAHQDDDATNGDNSGSAYVFDEPSGGWATGTETAKLIVSDGAASDEFGISVAVHGDTIVVGSYLDDDNGKDSGSAYVFTQDSNGWSQKTKLTGPSRGKGDWLGYSVAVAGNTVLAGAYQSNISGPDSGAVYLWVVPQWADIANSDATTTSHTVTGLTNRVEYTLQVRAVDKVEGAGAGPPSDPLRATPLKPKPAEPAGLSAAAGDSQVKLSWDDPAGGSPPVTSYQLWQHAENAILTAPSPTADDEFGYAVAIDGDTAVVGMPGDDDGTSLNVGAAFVFTSGSSGTWSQAAKLRASDPNAQDRFGLSVSVHEDTSNGDTIVVGAPHGSSSRGAVYVFTEPSDGWASTSTAAKLTASDRTDDDEFGGSVAVDGDTVVVGAHNNNSAYVFTRPATGWVNDTETLKLSGSGSSSFGRSVAIDGDTIVVGAIGQDDDRGSAFVFIKPATGWDNSPGTEVANLTAYSRNKDDRFGRSVAIDGDTIVVGAYGNDSNRGSAHVFTKPDTGWANSPGTETAKLTASVRNAEDHFGQSVAVYGDTVVIGADGLNNDENPGSAYAFTKPESGGWADSTEAAKLTGSGTANGDRFGLSVAVAGVTVMVGANGQGSNSQGAAYLYDIAVWADIAGSTGEARSHFATGLTNGLEHTFAVRAVNDGGASVPSDQTSETPAGAASLPIKPRNFSTVQTGADEVRLEWERSVQPLAVAGYRFIQDNTSSDDDVPAWTPISDSDSNTVSHTVSGLTEGDTYNFAVRAFNSQGDSDSSNSLSVTIVAAPAAPTGFTASAGDSHVELSWGNPGNSSITMYQYQQAANGAWTAIPGSGALTTSHLVSGLTNNQQYAFRIRAVNRAGEGAASPPVTATPAKAGAAPGKPANFSAAQTGVLQVGLTWDKASQPRTVTGYQFTQNGGSTWTNIDRSDSNTVSHTVSGLTEGDTYNFAVRAFNSEGVRASDSISVTIVAKPKRPTGVSATGGDTQATVQLGVPSDENDPPPIDKYQLLQIPLSTLTADDRAANDEFGYSVAVYRDEEDGDTAVVGTPGATNGTGAAYVFTRNSDTDPWSRAAKLTASVPAENDEFGTSVAVDGDTIVVGAHKADYINLYDSSNNLADSGAAYVFTKPESGGWAGATEPAKLTASDGAADDEFGISVAVHGETVVVGAHQNEADDPDNNEGAAYAFTKPGSGGWVNATETAKLTASDGAADDEFGVSVAVDEDTVAVGAHLHDLDVDGASMLDAGVVYVFTKPAAGWTSSTESARLTAPDGAAKDEFGISVAIDGDTVVVGAHQPTYQENNKYVDVGPGAAYVFTRDSNSGKWGQPVKLTASNGVLGDGFGISVAVDGNTAAVGAYLFDRDDGVVPGSGSAYVFARDPNSGKWGQTHNLAAPAPGSASDDWFGHSVAVSNDTVLAGVPQDDGTRGSAYAMDISTAEWVDFVSTELTMSDDDEYYVYRVRDLTNDREYAFRVRSVNAAGNQPSAETVSATPWLHRPVKPTGLVAEAGNRQVDLSWDLSNDSTIYRYQVLQHPEQSRLTVSDGADGDRFGNAVAVDGGTAVVGAPEHDGTDTGGNAITNSGAAYVFTKVSGVWRQVAKLTASDGDTSDEFGYSVAVHGNTIVVGARQLEYQSGGQIVSRPGAAYVFTRPDGGWVATSTAAKLTADDGVNGDRFGYSVAVHENTVVVGAYFHKVGAEGKAGAAYIFTKPDGGDWTSTSTSSKLTDSDGEENDYFGHSVAVHGGTIVIGAYRDKTNGIPTGAAYVFTRPVGGWVATSTAATLTASDGADGDQFGHSVAMDGATVVVGARKNDAAYAFIQDSGVWGQAAKFTASDSDGSEEFGSSVAVRGGTIVVGAYYANVDECDDCEEDPRSGAAYVFTKPAKGVWATSAEAAKLILPAGGEEEEDDQFGNSVALDGESVLVGAPQDDGFGSVYVSDIPVWTHIDSSNATTTSHTVTDLTNHVEYTFQVRAVDKVGESPPSNIAWVTPANRLPSFIDGNVTDRAVGEDAQADDPVGRPVTATDPDGDTLTYSLSGEHAGSFSIASSNGQISVRSGTTLNYESGRTSYTVIVSVHDDEASVVASVTINVNNVDEDGSVSLSSARPRVSAALTASLTDPDGLVSITSWQWARSANSSTGWRDIVRANSYRYRPVANDGGNYLRATASYTDGHGSGKEAAVVSTNRVRSLDRPETSPPPTPTPVPITVVPPGVGDATVPPGLLLVIGLMGMLLVIAGRIVVRERRSNSRL